MIQELVNNMGLRLNTDKLMKELLTKLEIELTQAFSTWESEVYAKRGNNDFFDYVEVEAEVKKKSNEIVAYLRANPAALADSYGTGSLMLESNPIFSEYYKKDKNWNPMRTSKTIVGRPRGSYINIFGEQVSTWGNAAGVKLEGYVVEPSPPSKAIEIANQWLFQTYLPNAYKNAVNSINFSKYLEEY